MSYDVYNYYQLQEMTKDELVDYAFNVQQYLMITQQENYKWTEKCAELKENKDE